MLELKIQQKLEKEAEEQEAKMNEARIEISMQKRKNIDIPSELLKIAKLDERAKPIGVKADNPTINLQQPNPPPFLGTNPIKPEMPDTGYHSASSGTFH